MKKIYCDRCGKESNDAYLVRTYVEIVIDNGDITRMLTQGDSNFDICGRCLEKVKEFIKNKDGN